MTEKQREDLRKQLVRQFTRNNRNWTYNGTNFEMRGSFGWRDLCVWVTFQNLESALEMEMYYHGGIPFYKEPDLPRLKCRFTGDDRFGQAIDKIAEYLERLAEAVLPIKEERTERSQEYDAKICAAVRAIAFKK